MPNNFLEVKNIARQTLPRLMNNLVFPNLVHRDFSNDFVPGLVNQDSGQEACKAHCRGIQ